jgi:hypothetical protein
VGIYPRVELDLDALEAFAGRIVLAGGRDSRDHMTYQPNRALAKHLGQAIVDFPGGHLGFLSDPASFARELMNTLKA